MRVLIHCLVFLIASTTVAATVTVGRLGALLTEGFETTGAVSYVDLQHRASSFGPLRRALVRWATPGTAPCDAAFKLVFVRPSDTVGTFSIVAERGPFPGHDGSNEIELEPPFFVRDGDMIGITQLQPSGVCGNVWLSHTTGSMFVMDGEVATGANAGLSYPGVTPGILASDDAKVVVGVVPVVGSGPGSSGSFFRTSLQLTSLDGYGISGTIVFHPAGRTASASDPSMPFNLFTWARTISIPDIVSAMGQSGLGSIDIVSNGIPPLVTSRVYNDGPGGSSGFVQDAIDPYEAPLLHSSVAVLHTPPDMVNYRMNIGVLTLRGRSDDLILSVLVYSAAGNLVSRTGGMGAHTYPGNYFEQTTAQAFTGTDDLPPDALIMILSPESTIIYATVTDNRTNATTIQFATPQ